MLSPLVSIIVPIYNADRFIEKCADSVSYQTYSNWELLLINDGSSDASLSICNTLAEKDYRIRVFDKPNTGVSDTRNFAIREIRGEYVIFLDADDFWIDNSALTELVTEALKNNLDIVRGEYLAVDEDEKTLYPSPVERKNRDNVISPADFLENVICGEFFLPLLLIKAELVKQYKFEVGRIFLEDMLFISQMLLKDLRCKYLADLTFYAYRKIRTSASHKTDFRMLRDAFTMCFKFEELSQLTDDMVLKQSYQHYRDNIYVSTMKTLASDDYYSMKDKVFREIDLEALPDRMIMNNIYTIVSPRTLLCMLRIRYVLSSVMRKVKTRSSYV